MKKHKKLSILIISLALVLILTPVLILAEEKGKKIERKQQGVACESISQMQSRVMERVGRGKGNLNGKHEEVKNRLQERKQERETKLEEKRNKWDENRENHFAKLEERAQTNEQKQAVIEFVETITKAVSVRRDAFDQAIADFQEALDAMHRSRIDILETAMENYEQGISQAFEKAEQDCENGVDIRTIRDNLRNDLKDVRSQYREDIQQFQGHGEDIQDLIEIKKEAMNEAKDEFKEILKEALEDLRVAFPEIEE